MLVNIVSHHREEDTTTTLAWGEVEDDNVVLELVDEQDATLLTIEELAQRVRGQLGKTVVGKCNFLAPNHLSTVNRHTELLLDTYAPMAGHEDLTLTHIEWVVATDREMKNICSR